MSRQSVSIAIAGYGGTGVITTGQLLLKACAKSGFFGLAQRSFGPQIRGGESLSLLRFSNQPVQSPDDFFDILVLLDTDHVARFSAEVPLNENSVVIIGKDQATTPDFVSASGAKIVELPLDTISSESASGGENIVSAGLLAAFLGLEKGTIQNVLRTHFAKKETLLAQAEDWLLSGWNTAEKYQEVADIRLVENTSNEPQWLVNGSDSCGLGALKAGIRFVAAYPITPASGILEWLAPNLEKLGGSLVQAEDELASINMIIGSSFGGIPSLTATSGPGLALMAESIGLAVASETPLVIVNVMRGGPSTGIPTKSEQSDLNMALHGLHGDAPHIVTSMLSIADSAFTTGWSVWLAEHLQVPVITLSDQSMAQSDASLLEPPMWQEKAERLIAAHSDAPYHRYALTDSGISPMSIPGEEDMMYTADGLEHNQHGTPSAATEMHREQLQKRAHKLKQFDYGDLWAEVRGQGESAIICWGSVSSVAFEAAERLTEQGQPCRVIALRLIAPLQTDALLKELENVSKVLVVEQSHGAQFMAWLRAHVDFPCVHQSLAMPGPLPIRPKHILNAFTQWEQNASEVEHVANC
jgi:2-oxoglutarate ferredoxin oxidoreductase subunit alpha